MIYVLDPMCSWCWGFRPALRAFLDYLGDPPSLRHVMGGLAPDTDQPMPAELRASIEQIWHQVQQMTGVPFNFDFWIQCRPRRSTYPACRAVIAVGLQGEEHVPAMVYAIQRAYYLNARNPSDLETLLPLARELGLNSGQFESDMASAAVNRLLECDFSFRHRLGADRFPSLALQKNDEVHWLTKGYCDAQTLIAGYRRL